MAAGYVPRSAKRGSDGVMEQEAGSAGPAKSRERGEDAKDKQRTPNTERRTSNVEGGQTRVGPVE